MRQFINVVVEGHSAVRRREFDLWIRYNLVYRLLGIPTLILYVALFIVSFVAFRSALQGSSVGMAAGVSLDLFTGADPRGVLELQSAHTFLGLPSANVGGLLVYFAWIVHLMSWLLIPALVGFLVADKVTRIREERVQDVRRAYVGVIETMRPELTFQQREEVLDRIMNLQGSFLRDALQNVNQE